MSPEDIRQLGAIGDPLRRRFAFVAALDRAIAGSSPTQRPIIVGGAAVEFYTTGGYTTQDLDLVLFNTDRAEIALRNAGFSQHGRYWHHPDADLLCEFPGKVLTYGDQGAYDRVQEVRIDEACCLVIGVEDLIIGRLWSAVDEGRANDRKWAAEMIRLFHDRIHWAALEQLAVTQSHRLLTVVQELRHA